MGVSQEQLNRAVSQARIREAQGYFEQARAGDQRAASLFVRLVAYDLNPGGSPADYGWLSKSPGESQVDGYAEDAICGNANPADLQNVVDLIVGTGAPGASIGGSVKERRTNNLWVQPRPLTEEEMAYLRGAEAPPEVPPFPPRDETLDAALQLNAHYRSRGAGENGTLGGRYGSIPRHLDIEGEAVWLSEYLRRRQLGEQHQQAVDNVISDINAAWPK